MPETENYTQPLLTHTGVSDVQPAALPSDMSLRNFDLVPVYGYAAGSLETGLNLSNGEIADWVVRHPSQRGIREAFAIYVSSNSMEPRYFQGELVYIHPGRPPERGKDCVIELKNGDAYIKRYLRQTETNVVTEQLNPQQEIIWPKNDVKAIYAVVGRG